MTKQEHREEGEGDGEMSEENEVNTGSKIVAILLMLGTAIGIFLIFAIYLWAIIVGGG